MECKLCNTKSFCSYHHHFNDIKIKGKECFMTVFFKDKEYITVFDFEDLEKVKLNKWCVVILNKKSYARARNRASKKQIYLHRLITNTPKGMDTDHINQDTLDNRKNNLRICNHKENLRNQSKQRSNTTGLKGVCWHKKNKKYVAQISVNNKKIYLGYFLNRFDAGRAYDKAALLYHKDFATFNFQNSESYLQLRETFIDESFIIDKC